MQNSNSKAGTEVPQSTEADVTTSSQTIAKPNVGRSAFLSDCKKYRYSLTRTWDENKPIVLFIMLNPSTADGVVDDPTIRRCKVFAEDWGYGGLYVGNLYPFRAKEPTNLLLAENPLGKLNGDYIKMMALNSELIICAWGNSGIVKKLQKRFPDYKPLADLNRHLHYLELSMDGTPKHPLYLKAELMPIKYETKSCRLS